MKGLANVAGRLDGVEQLREVVSKLELAARTLIDERQRLAGLVGTARQQDEQRAWLVTTGFAALVVGLLASPYVASTLPFGLDARVAALVLREDRWDAGMALMRAASPESWNELAAATQLARANSDHLSRCIVAASNAKVDQRCTITVPAP